MRWILFLLSLVALCVAYLMFTTPAPVEWALGVATTAFFVFVAAIPAWYSGKGFAKRRTGEASSTSEILKTPPAFVWCFVVTVFCIVGLIRAITN